MIGFGRGTACADCKEMLDELGPDGYDCLVDGSPMELEVSHWLQLTILLSSVHAVLSSAAGCRNQLGVESGCIVSDGRCKRAMELS